MDQQSNSGDVICPGHWLKSDRTKYFGKSFWTNATALFIWPGSQELRHRLAERAFQHPGRDIFQFGVYTCGTMRDLCHSVPGWRHMWGFDSFRGLPRLPTETISTATQAATSQRASRLVLRAGLHTTFESTTSGQ